MLQVQQVVQRGVSKNKVERVFLERDEIQIELQKMNVQSLSRRLFTGLCENLIVNVSGYDFVGFA